MRNDFEELAREISTFTGEIDRVIKNVGLYQGNTQELQSSIDDSQERLSQVKGDVEK
jgi:peptidoglycan hydrolase CwlO-like protein